MRKTEFMKMIEIENDKEDNMNELNKGDYFLYGKNMIAQKQNKIIGQSISYFEIINKKDQSIEYMPIFDYMEEDKGE